MSKEIKSQTDKTNKYCDRETNGGMKLNFTLEASNEKEYDILLMTGNELEVEEGGDLK